MVIKLTRVSGILLFSALISLSYAVKLGFPGEDIHIRSDRTGFGVDTTDTPEAFIEMRTTEDGILIPRLTIVQRDAIPSPPNGLMIYNLDCLLFNYYNGVDWIPFPNLMDMEVGPISGSTSICEGATGISYSIPDVAEATSYSWTIPEDAAIATGSGTRSITVDFGSDEGRICVIAHTPCGSQGDCINVSVAEAAVGGVVTGGGTIDFGDPTPTLPLSGHTGTIDRWQRRYESGGWTDISHTGTTYSEIPSMVGNWDYRAVIISSGCPDAYSDFTSVTVEGSVSGDSIAFTYTGTITSWTVPTGISSVEIEVWGAQGGNGGGNGGAWSSPGGLGARMRGVFAVTPGDNLRILVGEQGESVSYYVGGGGGGSFVWKDGAGIPMICAGGGGGGGGIAGSYSTYFDGMDAVTTENGTNGHNCSLGGGVSGYGGTGTGSIEHAGGGCGWYSNGVAGWSSGCTSSAGGTRPLEGGAGGHQGGNPSTTGDGGFGGGGQGACNATGGGGGGGYSGGGPGMYLSSYPFTGGGGGGSFNAGTAQSNSAGIRSGNGRVVIRW